MVPILGLASGIGGSHNGSAEGPKLLKKKWNLDGEWISMISSSSTSPPLDAVSKQKEVIELNTRHAEAVCTAVTNHPFTMIIGGDHSCGIGTWSGVATAVAKRNKELGLIWLDAHMDCHTTQTSPSGNIHGMPVASLLGIGDTCFTQILSKTPKVKPEHLFLVGIRSFESEEAALVEKLGIKVYYIEEVLERGLYAVLQEIIDYFKSMDLVYGISLDIDFFDPSQMPASGTLVPNGATVSAFMQSCTLFDTFPPVAFEYVEFNPPCDQENKSLESSLKLLERVMESYTTHRAVKTN